MIPLSLRVRKSCEDPFFNPGTLSRISSRSLSDITCLLRRAENKYHEIVRYRHSFLVSRDLTFKIIRKILHDN